MNLISKELIAILLDECKEREDKDVYIYETLNAMRRIDQDLAGYRQERIRIEIEYKKRLAELNEKVRAEQALCQHRTFSYHGDPAGGSDSFHECDLCGKQW